VGGRSAAAIAREVAGNAKWTLAVGACAWDGGLVQHGPTGGVGVQEAVPTANVVNLGGCPHNPANTVAVIVHYLTFGEMPALDSYNRPLFAYGDLIHDQCERRAYYDAGLFVEAWGDEGHRHGYCLYKMGCKGPSASYNCPNVRWNDGTSWPVEAGHNCIACASPEFWASMSPFYERLPNVPGFGADTNASTIGLAVIGGTTALMAAHAVGKKAHTVGLRAWDRTHPPEGEPAPPSVAHEHGNGGGEPASQSETDELRPREQGGRGGQDQD
jgi:hydrogenase small subunit